MNQTLEAIVNPFAGKESASPDNVAKKIPPVRNSKIDSALEKYKKLEAWGSGDPNWARFDSKEQWFIQISELNPETLTPAEIDILLDRILKETPKWKFGDERTGHYISYLVQLSYNAGHSDFHITAGHTPISCFLTTVSGTEQRRLKARILADFSPSVASNVNYLDVIVDGSVMGLGYRSNHSTFIINGNANSSPGSGSRDCEYVIEGNVEGIIDKVQRCTYTIEGKFSGLSDVRDSTFKTHNLETYEKMMASINSMLGGNKVELLK